MVPPYPRDGIRPRASIDGRAKCKYIHCTLGQRPSRSLVARPGARRHGCIALNPEPWSKAHLHFHPPPPYLCPRRKLADRVAAWATDSGEAHHTFILSCVTPIGLTFSWMAGLVDFTRHTPSKPTLAVRPSSSRQPESAQFHSGKKRLDLCTTSH